MYIAMQIYREGNRTFYNAISMRKYKHLSTAIRVAKEKAKGQPYVMKGTSIVWSPF